MLGRRPARFQVKPLCLLGCYEDMITQTFSSLSLAVSVSLPSPDRFQITSLCLLGSYHMRTHYCNDTRTLSSLLPSLSPSSVLLVFKSNPSDCLDAVRTWCKDTRMLSSRFGPLWPSLSVLSPQAVLLRSPKST